jgi:hypothetical protein
LTPCFYLERLIFEQIQKNGEFENKCTGDQIGTSKNFYIVLKTKYEFGKKIVKSNCRDTKKWKKAIRMRVKVGSRRKHRNKKWTLTAKAVKKVENAQPIWKVSFLVSRIVVEKISWWTKEKKWKRDRKRFILVQTFNFMSI